MGIDVFEIKARSKHVAAALGKIDDFELNPAGQISEAVVQELPDWTFSPLGS